MANENGWGDGVLNNTIGWGRGSDNEIGWGSIYSQSDAGLTALEDSGGGFDPDAAAFFAANSAEGGAISPEVQAAWNTWILALKANSLYDGVVFGLPHLGGVIDAALLDMISLVPFSNQNLLDSDVDPLLGVTSDGSTKSSQSPSFSGLVGAETNLYCVSFFDNAALGSNKYFFGILNSTATNSFFIRSNLSNLSSRILSNIMNGTGLPTSPASVSVLIPTESNTPTLRINETTNITSSLIGTPQNQNLSLFALTNTTDTIIAHALFKSNGWFLCKNYSTTQANLFNTLYNTFLTEIGAI